MKRTTRRNFLLGGAGVLAAALSGAWFGKNELIKFFVRRISNDDLKLTPAPDITGDPCVLTSSQTEGPYFISAPARSDIREDRKGKEFRLKLQVVRMPGCEPVEGAVVEIWHSDAEGVYSAYPAQLAHDPWATLMTVGTKGEHIEPTTESRFLRGSQLTNPDGIVDFTTIMPGWYEPRPPHIHFKILVNKNEAVTSQFYFKPESCNKVYTSHEAYAAWGESPYTPKNDPAIKSLSMYEAKGLELNPEWNESQPLEAAVKIGIKVSS